MTSDVAFNFSGRRVLITGSTKGIGRAIAEAYAKAGAHVVVHGRSAATAAAVADELAKVATSGGTSSVAFDVTDGEAAANAVSRIGAEGHLHVLVSNAGYQNRTRVDDLSIDTYRNMIDGNLVAHFALSKAATKVMANQGDGRIVIMASILALHGRAGLSAYCSAKAGVIGLVRVLAAENAGRGVRINAVGPGFVATDMTADVANQPGFSDRVVDRTPAGRWGAVEDIVGPTLFLTSDAARFVHGQILYADGGLTAVF
jgi:gluconate 5-dehydrogenase